MASTGAVPFWRAAGMTYITYSNLCANMVRQCLKEPYRSEAIAREKVHFSLSKWVNAKPEKPKLEIMRMSQIRIASSPSHVSELQPMQLHLNIHHTYSGSMYPAVPLTSREVPLSPSSALRSDDMV